MKTDDLIAAISADAKSARPPIASIVWLAAGAGLIGAAIVFLSLLQIRPDIGEAVFDPSFLYKWVLTLTLLASAMVAGASAGAPATHFQRPAAAAAGACCCAPGSALPMNSSCYRKSEWMPTMIGNNAAACMIFIPMMSALPLAAFLVALRQGAPSRPALTGAVAGLASTGIGATLYASHCTNDSPLFMAAWYVIGASRRRGYRAPTSAPACCAGSACLASRLSAADGAARLVSGNRNGQVEERQ